MTEDNGKEKNIMFNLPKEILYTINEFKYGDKQYNRKKFNRVINELNDYIKVSNINNTNNITPNLLLNDVLCGCFENYLEKDYELYIIKIDPFNVLHILYGEFYEEPFNLNDLD